MKLISSVKTLEKKSRFLGFYYELSCENELKTLIKTFEQEHKKATHICYGAIIDSEVYFKNDREVGNPGKLLLNILLHKKKDQHLLLVVRYFGGIKLGVGGVQRAFKNCASECLEK